MSKIDQDVTKEELSPQIKEIGVPEWIGPECISSGMFKSLVHISELYLSTDGTLFLIDEFENSLGINCIDELTTDILQSGRKLQFILTSHHPYIINCYSFQKLEVDYQDKRCCQNKRCL